MKSRLIRKDPNAGKSRREEEKGPRTDQGSILSPKASHINLFIVQMQVPTPRGRSNKRRGPLTREWNVHTKEGVLEK